MTFIQNLWIWFGVIACIVQSALFAGLNLAVFSLSLLRLQIAADGGSADAKAVLDLRKNSNQVLATVIWGNVSTNVLLTLLSDSVLAGLGAFSFGDRDHVARRDLSAGLFLAQRVAHDRAPSSVPELLPRCAVSPNQADRNAA